MKKLIMTAAIVCAAAFTQAASVAWTNAGLANYKGDAYYMFVVGQKGVESISTVTSILDDGKDFSSYVFGGGTVNNSGAASQAVNSGIVLVTRLWVTRAGGLPAPISPSYQQAGTNMKRRRDRFRYFLLLLFLTRAIKMEIRHGVVIPFDLWTRPLCQPLASGHCFRLGSSTASSGCVHYSLICTSARSCQQTDWQ